MEKIIPDKTEVLIFEYIEDRGPNQDYDHYIKGVIVSSRIIDLSYHGSLMFKAIYTVLGEDGKYYCGCYGSGLIGYSFFMTVKDFIKYKKNIIKDNIKKINKLTNESLKLEQDIETLEKSLTEDKQKKKIK